MEFTTSAELEQSLCFGVASFPVIKRIWEAGKCH